MKKWLRRLLMLPPAIFLLAFLGVPSLIMLAAAFLYPGDFSGLRPLRDSDGAWLIQADNWREFLTFEHFERFFQDPIYLSLFAKSFAYAGLTTLICLLLAYPLAILIAQSTKRQRDLLVLLVILPFWSNFLIRVYAWMILLGPQGWLAQAVNAVLAWLGYAPQTLLFTPFAVVLVLVYVHLPFMVLPLYANLERHDAGLIEAARDLGASRWQCFWHVTWPQSLPGVYAGAALVFIPALGMFAVPDLVGGTGGFMVGNLIKQQFMDSRDWPFGAVLSLFLTLAVLLVAAIAARLGRGGRHAL